MNRILICAAALIAVGALALGDPEIAALAMFSALIGKV
jgi:hypothetical protein